MKFQYLIIILLVCPRFVHQDDTIQKAANSCGTILYKYRIFDTISNQFVMPTYHKDRKIWYRNNIVIQEALKVYIHTDPFRRETSKVVVDHYTYIDLNTKSFYEYRNFSDTAAIKRKYTQPDSASIDGCWNFYKPSNFVLTKNLKTIADTVMHGITYKRVKSFEFQTEGSNQLETIAWSYLRCDKKNSLFRMDPNFSKQMGCPLVRYEHLWVPKNMLTSFEIEFVADKLTSEEEKVFDAWERNAKKFPIK